MARVYATVIVNAPVDQAWDTIRDFNALPRWHPFVTASRIEDDLSSVTIGCVRNFQLGESGETIREQLRGFSDPQRSVTYSIVESGLPISNYLATLRLIQVTEGDSTLGEWQADFDVDLEHETEMVALVKSVFVEGLKNLSQLLSK